MGGNTGLAGSAVGGEACPPHAERSLKTGRQARFQTRKGAGSKGFLSETTMGVQDRDWYQEHWLRNVLGVRRRVVEHEAPARSSWRGTLFWVAVIAAYGVLRWMRG